MTPLLLPSPLWGGGGGGGGGVREMGHIRAATSRPSTPTLPHKGGGRRKAHAAPRISPLLGGGTGTPSAAYSLSLLRKVRIEMPRMFAAWVRLPRQCLRVSKIRSRSTSATVRPTSARVTCSAAKVGC